MSKPSKITGQPLHVSYDADRDTLVACAYGAVPQPALESRTVGITCWLSFLLRKPKGTVIGFVLDGLSAVDVDDHDPTLWTDPRFTVPVLGLTDAGVGEIILRAAARSVPHRPLTSRRGSPPERTLPPASTARPSASSARRSAPGTCKPTSRSRVVCVPRAAIARPTARAHLHAAGPRRFVVLRLAGPRRTRVSAIGRKRKPRCVRLCVSKATEAIARPRAGSCAHSRAGRGTKPGDRATGRRHRLGSATTRWVPYGALKERQSTAPATRDGQGRDACPNHILSRDKIGRDWPESPVFAGSCALRSLPKPPPRPVPRRVVPRAAASRSMRGDRLSTVDGGNEQERSARRHMMRASEMGSSPPPTCLTCGQPMTYYGGSAGFIHCEWKLLHREGGWFDPQGRHIKDDRLAGGTRRVDGEVRVRKQ